MPGQLLHQKLYTSKVRQDLYQDSAMGGYRCNNYWLVAHKLTRTLVSCESGPWFLAAQLDILAAYKIQRHKR